jgi:hypothetical protein
MNDDPLHSIPSAANFLGGVSVWTVRAWLTQARLKRTKVGSRTFIRESELLRLLAEDNA